MRVWKALRYVRRAFCVRVVVLVAWAHRGEGEDNVIIF